MKRTLLLFDIDGTLLLTGGAGMRAMDRVAKRLFHPEFSWEGIVAGGNLDPLIFAEAAGINGLDDDPSHHSRFHDAYIDELHRELENSLHQVRTMPGIHPLLAMLREREELRGDLVLGLLTGNYTKAVPMKLRTIGVDVEWFRITAFGDEGRTRPDLVAVAMRKYEDMFHEQVNPRKVVVIGDTPRDVACARAHGCVAFAVATGGYDVEKLRAAGADVATENLAAEEATQALLRVLDGR